MKFLCEKMDFCSYCLPFFEKSVFLKFSTWSSSLWYILKKIFLDLQKKLIVETGSWSSHFLTLCRYTYFYWHRGYTWPKKSRHLFFHEKGLQKISQYSEIAILLLKSYFEKEKIILQEKNLKHRKISLLINFIFDPTFFYRFLPNFKKLCDSNKSWIIFSEKWFPTTSAFLFF